MSHRSLASAALGLALMAAQILGCQRTDLPIDEGGLDKLDTNLRALAGAQARDCGRFASGKDRANATACEVAAFRAGQPFFVRFDQQGIDSVVAEGVAIDPNGRLYSLGYDSSPGGGGVAADGGDVWQRSCPRAEIRLLDGREFLACAEE